MIENTELEELAHALELGEGFALHFVVCNTPALYPQLLESVRAKVPAPIYPLTIPRDFDGLIDVWLAEQVHDFPKDAVIFLYGLADMLAIEKHDEASCLKRHHILQQLNWQRNAYQRLQRGLVIWVRTDAMRLIALYASDFYDWRTGVFEYHPPQEQRCEVVRQSVSSFDSEWNALLGLPLAEKRRWLSVLQGLIDELAHAATSDEQQMLAKLLNDQGELYLSLGEYELAKRCFKKTLVIRENILGKQHPDYVESLNNLASVYRDQGQYPQALPLFQEALAIAKQISGENPRLYTMSLNNLANLYQDQGQYEQAIPLYHESLKVTEQVSGKQHSDYATSLNNLAGLYEKQGQYEQALPLYQEASIIFRQVLGKQHPSYATSLHNLAHLYRKQGQYVQARLLYQEVLKITEQGLGKQHSDYGTSLNGLANLYQLQGEYDKALPLFQEALNILNNALGEQHPHTQTVRRNYESLLEQLQMPPIG